MRWLSAKRVSSASTAASAALTRALASITWGWRGPSSPVRSARRWRASACWVRNAARLADGDLGGERCDVAAAPVGVLDLVETRARLGRLGARDHHLRVHVFELLFGDEKVAGSHQPIVGLEVFDLLFRVEDALAQDLEPSGQRDLGLARGVRLPRRRDVDVGARGGVGEFGGLDRIAIGDGEIDDEGAFRPLDLNSASQGGRGGGRAVRRVRRRTEKGRQPPSAEKVGIGVELFIGHHALEHRARRDDQALALDVVDEAVGILPRRRHVLARAGEAAGVDVDLRDRDIARRERLRRGEAEQRAGQGATEREGLVALGDVDDRERTIARAAGRRAAAGRRRRSPRRPWGRIRT